MKHENRVSLSPICPKKAICGLVFAMATPMERTKQPLNLKITTDKLKF